MLRKTTFSHLQRLGRRHFSMRQATVRECLNGVLFEEFERDPSVIIMGEEVAE